MALFGTPFRCGFGPFGGSLRTRSRAKSACFPNGNTHNQHCKGIQFWVLSGTHSGTVSGPVWLPFLQGFYPPRFSPSKVFILQGFYPPKSLSSKVFTLLGFYPPKFASFKVFTSKVLTLQCFPPKFLPSKAFLSKVFTFREVRRALFEEGGGVWSPRCRGWA